MSSKLAAAAVFAVFAILILNSSGPVKGQTIGRTLSPTSGLGVGPVGPVGGVGGLQDPLRLSTDLSAPDLRGTLPVFQTPKLDLPQDAEPGAAVNDQTGRRTWNEPDTSITGPEISRVVVATSGGEPDSHDEDDNDDEKGNVPWWLLLLLVAGVLIVLSRRKR